MVNDIAISAKSTIVPDLPWNSCSQSSINFLKTDFDTRTVLGKKGTRNMDKLTGLTIHCINRMMAVLSEQREAEPERMGIVVGTAQGSMDSIVRFTYETLAYGRPDYVNPALFPNTVMNCAAGQTAIWYGIKGPNATISSDALSSFAAINYAISLLQNRYADTLIAGGVEELTEVNIAANIVFAKKHGIAAKFTESSAFFVVESAKIAAKYRRPVLAYINAIRIGFNPDTGHSTALSKLIDQVVNDAGIDKSDIKHISTAGMWPQTKAVERCAVEISFDGITNIDKILQQDSIYGNAVSSHNALQLNSIIEKIDQVDTALMLAQDLKGNIAAMVISGGKSR
jgi:3-oxoacyl-[acyl-carrier-protein] synthase II